MVHTSYKRGTKKYTGEGSPNSMRTFSDSLKYDTLHQQQYLNHLRITSLEVKENPPSAITEMTAIQQKYGIQQNENESSSEEEKPHFIKSNRSNRGVPPLRMGHRNGTMLWSTSIQPESKQLWNNAMDLEFQIQKQEQLNEHLLSIATIISVHEIEDLPKSYKDAITCQQAVQWKEAMQQDCTKTKRGLLYHAQNPILI